jgi:hypothetical protein
MVDVTGLASTALEFIHNAFSTVKHYIKEVGVYVKDVGRVTLKYGYEIGRFFGDPIKGVPTAMALYLGTRYIRVDVSGILQWIDATKDKLKEIRFAETVDEWIKGWIASWLNINPMLPYWQVMNPMVVWQGLYNAPWAPHWIAFGVDWATPLLAIIFVPIYIFIVILGAVIALCYLLQWLYYLLVDFAFTVLRYLVSGFAWVVNTVVDFIGFVSCNYLKLMMPAIPVLMAMRFSGKGLRGMLTGTVVGTLATWVAVTAFTPECSIFKPVEFVTLKPTPPEIEKYIDKSVRPYVSAEYLYLEQYIEKSVKPVLEYSAVYGVEQYIEKSVKPVLEYSAVYGVEQYIEKSVKPIIELSTITVLEYGIDRSVKSDVSYKIYNLIYELTSVKIDIKAYIGISDVTSNVSVGMEVVSPQKIVNNVSVDIGVEITT